MTQRPKIPSGKVVIRSTDADVFPLLASATNRATAAAVHMSFVNRGGRRNVELVEQLVRLRHEKARLLGYDSFAALALEPTWAKTPAAVRDFLDEARLAVVPSAKAELEAMRAEHARLGGKRAGALTPADRYFYEARLRETLLGPAAKSLPEHFEFDRTETAMVDLVGELFGLRFDRGASGPRAWHPDVHAYDVIAASDGARVGRLYLDLRGRHGKYQYEAMFALAGYRGSPGGSLQLPEAAVVCSFAPPASALGGKPAFFTHDQVVTLLHELGHAVHHLLARTEVASLARLTALDDFAEVPGQVLEEWAFSAPVLGRLARHHLTGAPLPADAIAALQKARNVGRALATQRQLFLASLDLELHSRTPPLDSTALVEELGAHFESLAPIRGAHPQGSFEHLARLPARYYGYQWARWLARDVLEPFAAEGFPAATASKRFAEQVLQRGGGMEPSKMVEAFLGRPPRRDAYIRFLSSE
jgi:thimet oligopeptidase